MNRTQYKIYRAIQGAKVHVVMTFARLVGVPVDVHFSYYSRLNAKDPSRPEPVCIKSGRDLSLPYPTWVEGVNEKG